MTCTDRTAKHRFYALGLLLVMLASLLLGMPVQASTVEIKTMSAANSALSNGALRGIDVSKWQGNIDWARVAGDNVQFAFIRASLGTEIDETFVRNAQGAHANGIKVGAYHYAKWTDRASMQEEAALFISQLKRVEITYPVALDVEANRGMNRSTLTALSLEFMDLIQAAGYTPMIYSYTNFISVYIDLNQISNAGYKYWVANYLEEPRVGQSVWQHTSYGSVSGISGRVDINIAYEDLSLGRRIVVDSDVSRSIKETLNDRYNVGLPLDSLNMTDMRYAVVCGLQREIARQFEVAFAVTGELDASTLDYLDRINYVQGSTQGNITYLIQVMLFYKGHYTGALTGAYDDRTAQALAAFQSSRGLSGSGQVNPSTLDALFTA